MWKRLEVALRRPYKTSYIFIYITSNCTSNHKQKVLRYEFCTSIYCAVFFCVVSLLLLLFCSVFNSFSTYIFICFSFAGCIMDSDFFFFAPRLPAFFLLNQSLCFWAKRKISIEYCFLLLENICQSQTIHKY